MSVFFICIRFIGQMPCYNDLTKKKEESAMLLLFLFWALLCILAL